MENLKSQIADLQQQIGDLQKHLSAYSKEVLNVKDLAIYSGLSVGYIYNLVSAKKIPHYKGDGGKLTFFKKSEIDGWMCSSYVPTYKEMEQKAIAYCVENKKGGVI